MKSALVIASVLIFSYVATAVVQQASYGGFACVDGFCLNGGTCTTNQGSETSFFGSVSTTPTTATCSCASGYSGPTCEYKLIYDCWGYQAPDVWVGDGLCQNGNAKFNSKFISFNCAAFDYDGGDCGTTPATANTHSACTATTCGTGKCYGSNTQYWCSCPRNSAGGNCQVTVDACSASPCKNGARCINDITQAYNYLCVCASYLNYDKNCSSTYPTGGGGASATCSTGCSGHGTCVIDNYCSCNTGYYPISSNSDCAANTACDSSPCQNGGTCVKSSSTNSYSCTCASGYEGTNCQNSITLCHPEPCLNAGVCKSSGSTYWNCDCTTAYRGINCTFGTASGFSCTSNSYDATMIPPAWLSDGVCENKYTYFSTSFATTQERYTLVGTNCGSAGAGDKDCPSELAGSAVRFSFSVIALVLMSIAYFL